jgi:uncharacterized protein (DUF1501 family)
MTHDLRFSRRKLISGGVTLFTWAHLPKLARAEGRDPRFLVIILRGALDGLAAVPPIGDPDWVSVRGENALTLDSKLAALKLDDFFALHPAMPNFHRLYGAGEATIVHASATGYRDRSHFDGQDVLESGFTAPGAAETGWLNRTLASLTPDGSVQSQRGQTFAVGPVTPLVARGPAPILVWAPQQFPPATDDTIMRLHDLYSMTDVEFAHVLEERMQLTPLAGKGAPPSAKSMSGAAPTSASNRYFADAAGGAAKILAHPDGPRIGALAFDGWDTHANEGVIGGRLASLLSGLDGAIAAAKENMGDAWSNTVIAVVTEFGRTVHVNGTAGTDHGTATVALLAGGALKGGRVIADWPGLKDANLYEGRDLKPTTDVRAVLKGLLSDHLRVDERALTTSTFPGSESIKPMRGLLKA